MILAGGLDKSVGTSMNQIYGKEGVLIADSSNPMESVKPFDEDSSGTALGDGGAFFVVETLESAQKRNAPILCEILGYDLKAYPGNVHTPSAEGIIRVLMKLV